MQSTIYLVSLSFGFCCFIRSLLLHDLDLFFNLLVLPRKTSRVQDWPLVKPVQMSV